MNIKSSLYLGNANHLTHSKQYSKHPVTDANILDNPNDQSALASNIKNFQFTKFESLQFISSWSENAHSFALKDERWP